MPVMPEDFAILLPLGVALGLGLLVGLEREWEKNRVAGLRTFALITLAGALAGLLAEEWGSWVMAAALLSAAGLAIAGYVAETRHDGADPGITTEVAMFVMFSTGALTAAGHYVPSLVVAGSVMVLLHQKQELHGIVGRFGEKDLREIARLVLIGLVILPMLPNRALGGNDLLNPFSIGLMVVLIVGISLIAYLAGKFLGRNKGTVVAGILGGLISSTATTLSVARRSKQTSGHGGTLAVIVLLAGAVVFVRVIGEVMLVAPGVLRGILPPLVAMTVASFLIALLFHRFQLKHEEEEVEEAPPSELKSAVAFGLLYVLVLLAVSYAKDRFGDSGLYIVAAISGLTDMDAITLSTARLANQGQIETATAWRLILTGGLANVVFKGAMVLALGSRSFLKTVLPGFAITLGAGAAILVLWPW